jgi:hypothetical protein
MNRLYAYLYDDFLSDAVFQKIVANIETRASALGIQGRTSRLAIFRSPRELVEQLVRDGAQTVVIVGNDRTLQKVMWFMPDLPVVVGYIPVAEPSEIARVLGIPLGDAACNVLAARRIETLDIGRIADRYFLTEAVIRDTAAAVEIDASFRISPSPIGTIAIRNLGLPTAEGAPADAKDGKLEVSIEPFIPAERKGWFSFSKVPETPRPTRLFMKEGSVVSKEPVDVLVDGQSLNGFGFSVSVIPKKFSIITGREKRLKPVSQGLPGEMSSAMLPTASFEKYTKSDFHRIQSNLRFKRFWPSALPEATLGAGGSKP